MKSFTDAAGRTWSITLNLFTVMQVKESLEVNLLEPELGDPPLLTRLGSDELLLAEVICCLIADQFEAQNVEANAVRRSFDGATILAAHKAFFEEWVDFFRQRGRTDRAKAIATQHAMIELAIQKADQTLEAIDPAKAVDGAMSGALADLSASIPGH